MSVAPEIARLAETVLLVTPRSAADQPDVPGVRLTLGTLSRRLRMLAATPERWWGLVRFDPDRPVNIAVAMDPGCHAWLMVLPPGDSGQPCDCDVVTMIAGEAIDGAEAARIGLATGFPRESVDAEVC